MKKWLVSVLFCLLSSTVFAADDNVQHTPNTTVELHTNSNNEIIAEFTMAPLWHIYWKNSGEIGQPTQIKADGAEIEALNQSTPKVHTIYDVLHEYFYDNKAYFYLKFNTLPRELQFDFVECNNICKPESVHFNLQANQKLDDQNFSAVLAVAEQTFPQKITLLSPTAKNILHTDKIGDKPVDFIPAQSEVVDAESVVLNDNSISWQTIDEQRLKQALILTDDKAYLADIVYDDTADYSPIYIILLAFFGGVLLNAMPCVFPILSLKIFTLLREENRTSSPWRNAMSYTAGVFVSFMILTTCLVVLKMQGEALGWGFQLQSPWFVGTMSLLFFVLFLFMVEWLPFPAFANDFIHKAAGLNEFTTGFFAVMVASPCTGPFMGAAIGYAFMQSTSEVYLIFAALAAGYALPYALIELYPERVAQFLPKQGAWMQKVKTILAIPVLLTAFWLASVWFKQISDVYFATDDSGLQWQEYDAEKIENLNAQNEKVFVYFTADWCLTCKFNEKIILNTDSFKQFAQENNLHLFKADMTEQSEEYFNALTSYGRDGIPLYVYYQNGQYKILPLFFSVSELKK
ncbi:MAG: thioredoxin family protein [Alphaproteobacteria bacterium]|nr:thioredoxin family protein [Alphaproteobacteria bacterium]